MEPPHPMSSKDSMTVARETGGRRNPVSWNCNLFKLDLTDTTATTGESGS